MDWCLFHREQNAVERLEIDKKKTIRKTKTITTTTTKTQQINCQQ